MSRNIMTDDALYGGRKRTYDEVGTAPSEFAPPSRETPYVPDPMAPPSENRAALHYPYPDPSGRIVA